MAVEIELLPPRYRLPRRIGRGAMGDIYVATDEVLGREVAVKVLADRYAADDAIRQRFKREALAAARLSGEPGAVTIFDVGEWRERPFIVMEHLGGGSLEDRLRRDGAQPPDRALAWLEQAAAALDAAHRHGIVHRDVKPANLLLDDRGQLRVADFGIASAAGFDSMTLTGTVLGTAGYLSPEQAAGERAGPASDRYALAVVAFELLSGRRPFESESATAEAAAHVNAPVPSIAELCDGLPWDVDRVFQRALAKGPRARGRAAQRPLAHHSTDRGARPGDPLAAAQRSQVPASGRAAPRRRSDRRDRRGSRLEWRLQDQGPHAHGHRPGRDDDGDAADHGGRATAGATAAATAAASASGRRNRRTHAQRPRLCLDAAGRLLGCAASLATGRARPHRHGPGRPL
jgi:serine/threonine protein kinase